MSEEAGQLHLIHGEERYLVDEAARTWRRQLLESGSEVEVFDSPARLVEAANSIMEIPLFQSRRCVVLRDPPQLLNKPVRGADGPEALVGLLERRAPETSVGMVVHDKVPTGNPVLAALVRLGGKVSYFPQLRGAELRSWIQAEARRRELRLGAAALDHVLRATGGDLGALTGELEKLSAFAPGGAPSLEEVKRLVGGADHVEMWAVMERLLGEEPARAAGALASLLSEGRATQYLLATLSGQVRELLLAQAVLAKTSARAGRLAEELKLPQWRAERLMRQASSVSPTLVEGWLRDLQRLDAQVKAGEMGDVEGLHAFIIRAARSVIDYRAARSPQRQARSGATAGTP